MPMIPKKLISLQNKTGKLIGGGFPHESASTLFSKCKMLKVPDLMKLEIVKLVHTHSNKKLPDTFSNYFALRSNISQTARSTNAHSKRLYTHRYKTNRLQNCIKYQGSKI